MKTLIVLSLMSLSLSLNVSASENSGFPEFASCQQGIDFAESFDGAQQEITQAWSKAADNCAREFAGIAGPEKIYAKLGAQCVKVWGQKEGSMFRTIAANCRARAAHYVTLLVDREISL